MRTREEAERERLRWEAILTTMARPDSRRECRRVIASCEADLRRHDELDELCECDLAVVR